MSEFCFEIETLITSGWGDYWADAHETDNPQFDTFDSATDYRTHNLNDGHTYRIVKVTREVVE